MSNGLTPTEEKVYQYLIEFLAANSYQPSIREIGRQFAIKSTKTVSDVLGSLARKGYIQRNQARSRGLRILGAQPQSGGRSLPFYPRVSAFGSAITPDLHSDAIVIDRRLAPSDNAFFVRVSDDGMAALSIHRHDTVLVSPDFTALDGDLVAVRAGHGVVVRTIQQRGNSMSLIAADDSFDPIDVPAGDDQLILGFVGAVFRATMLADEALDPDAEAAA
jgi:repressor LexA